MESTASTFTVEIEGKKKTTTKTKFHFLHLSVYESESCGSLALFLPKTGYPIQDTPHTLVKSTTLRQSQPVWFRPLMHSTGQAAWLPSSFPRSRVSVSFSFSPVSCCVQASALFIIIQHPRCSCSCSTSEGNLVKSAVSSYPLSLFPILSSPLSSSLFLSFLSLLLVFFLRIPSSDSEFRTHAA